MLYKILWVVILITHGVCATFDDAYKETAMSYMMTFYVVFGVFLQIVGVGT